MPVNCPHCGSDLTGPPIPDEYLAAGMYAPDSTHYSRTIGNEVRGVCDGVLYWQCPDCGGRWHRWPIGSRLFNLAEDYISDRT